jgi:phospholipase C
MIISPFVRRHYVGHAAMDHTAVLHFVEQRFGLAALTKRDAAQPSLLDFFDFTNKPWATPPAQTSVPTPAVVGSSCHPSSM